MNPRHDFARIQINGWLTHITFIHKETNEIQSERVNLI